MSIPILVMADIHGNLEALKAVMKDAAGEYEKIWVLGDVCGYGPDPGACIDLLCKAHALIVAGNHDLAVCGRIDSNNFNAVARLGVEIHRQVLSQRHISLLRELQPMCICQSVTLVHGNPFDPIWGYVLNDQNARIVLEQAKTSLTLCGHSHLPGFWGLNGKKIVYKASSVGAKVDYQGFPHLANPGSVGLSRSRDQRARYMIVNPIRKTILFRGVRWNKRALRRKMLSRNYPSALIERMGV